LRKIADRQFGFHAARIDVAIGFDRDFRTRIAVAQEIEPARPAAAEIVVERGFGKSVGPGAPARPDFADPSVGRRAEKIVGRPVFVEPFAVLSRKSRQCHAAAFEQAREFRLEFLGIDIHMEIVEPGAGQHPDSALEQVVENLRRYQIARRLHDDLDAAIVPIARLQALDHLVGNILADRIEQRFAARQNDAPGLFGQGRVVAIAIGHARRQRIDDARIGRDRFRQHTLHLGFVVGPKTFFIAMFAAPMAGPTDDVINRFHDSPVQQGSRRRTQR